MLMTCHLSSPLSVSPRWRSKGVLAALEVGVEQAQIAAQSIEEKQNEG